VQKAGLRLELESLTLLSQQAPGTLHHPARLEAAAEMGAPSPRALEQEPEWSLGPPGGMGILLS